MDAPTPILFQVKKRRVQSVCAWRPTAIITTTRLARRSQLLLLVRRRRRRRRLLELRRDGVVEDGKVAVVVGHRAAQRRGVRRRHQVEHGVVPDGGVLGLALGVHLVFLFVLFLLF